MSGQPGAADVICNSQEMKKRPGKTELSGLMNPCRGAAVGLDYYHKGQTHIPETHTHTQADLRLSISLSTFSSKLNQ